VCARYPDRFILVVIDHLVVFHPRCQSLDVGTGVVQAGGAGVERLEVVHDLERGVERIDLVLGGQGATDITRPVVENDHEPVVLRLRLLVALEPAVLPYAQGGMLRQPLPEG